MSRDSLEKSVLIGITAVSAVFLMAAQGLVFPVGDLANPVGVAVLLGGAAWYYRRKGVDTFVLALTALLHVTFYSACFSVLMYAVAAIGRPFVDGALAAADLGCGVHVPAIKSWVDGRPWLRTGLQFSYNSLMWQTPLAIVVLGFSGDRRRLEGFVRQFMICTLACAAVFALWPAEGPFSLYGFEPNATQARYLQHLHELRDGVRTVITWRGAEGLITFPSFHTGWAILLAWSLAGRGWLSRAIILLNAVVVVSTMTTGWHYFADVLGGAVAAACAIAASAAWEKHRAAATAPAFESAEGDVVPAPARLTLYTGR